MRDEKKKRNSINWTLYLPRVGLTFSTLTLDFIKEWNGEREWERESRLKFRERKKTTHPLSHQNPKQN